MAKRLAKQVKGHGLGPDFDAGDLDYDRILARVRHHYTNYEALLWQLPTCVDFWESGSECDWDPRAGQPCILEKEARELLKQTATEVAAEAYQRWLVETRQS
jgi:hypothetical protein